MAKVFSSCQGFRAGGYARNKKATRLGDSHVETHAQTWRTFVSVVVDADGSVDIEVKRDGCVLQNITIQKEA